MDESTRRLLQNEALFLQVNERLHELGETFDLASEDLEFICECSDIACTARISMRRETYERIRARPGRVFMLPGHERTEVETVVDRNDGYVVAQKPEDELAEAEP